MFCSACERPENHPVACRGAICPLNFRYAGVAFDTWAAFVRIVKSCVKEPDVLRAKLVTSSQVTPMETAKAAPLTDGGTMTMATRTDTQSPAPHVADSHDVIRVQGARENPHLARPTHAGGLAAVVSQPYPPHRSAANSSARSRRALYLTYNVAARGDLREAYYADKRAAFATLGQHSTAGTQQIRLIGHFQGAVPRGAAR